MGGVGWSRAVAWQGARWLASWPSEPETVWGFWSGFLTWANTVSPTAGSHTQEQTARQLLWRQLSTVDSFHFVCNTGAGLHGGQ